MKDEDKPVLPQKTSKSRAEVLLEEALQLHSKHMKMEGKAGLASERKLMKLLRDAHTILKGDRK